MPPPPPPSLKTFSISKRGTLTCGLQLLFAGEAHLHHVVVVLQEALQLLPDGLHARVQPLVSRLDLSHPLQVRGRHLCTAIHIVIE